MADKIEQQINNATAAIQKLNREIANLQAKLRTGNLNVEQIQKFESVITSLQTKLVRLNAEREKMFASSGRAGSERPWWEGGFQPGDTPHRPTPTPAKNPLTDLTAEQKSKAITQNAKYILQLEQELKATERAASSKAKLAAKEKELADLRSRVANDPIFREYLTQLQARGLGLEDIKSATSRGGDITRITASRMQGGIKNEYQAFVNEKTGTSTPGLSSQFRSFGKDIIRDIGQFTKWSIAVAAVYTPMQKLGELITVMIDNESRLADATIAANVPFEDSGKLFSAVAISANQAGESINTTIDAYTQAVRATGAYTSEANKQVATTKLLNDSLTLSKLSTLDQSESIDTLSAALIQSGRELTQGTELLNKWVRVQQIANVDLAALATGVAVLGDSAETAGVDVDHLNGLIAVLSANSISGSKEAANTAKALVGAYQSDKAEAALSRYGVALRKANGEVRGFLEIYQELGNLQKQGILSPEAVSELAIALGGGGSRRAAQASALIGSQEKLNKIAAESAKITGEDTLAQDSLSKKLETVQTANTRLANSFQELAQTLGDKGGLLDGFREMVNLLTSITKGTSDLFAALGRSGPLLTTFVGGMIALQSLSSGRRDTLLAQLGGGVIKQFGPGGVRLPDQIGRPNAFGAGIASDILRMNYRGAGILGAAGVGLQAGSNLLAGKTQNAEANVIGGAIGAAIGAYLGGPPGLAIGANVGSAAGDAFINVLFTHSEDLANYLFPQGARPPASANENKPTQVELDQKSLSELLDMASKSLGVGGNLKAFFAAGNFHPFGQQGNTFSYQYGGQKDSAVLAALQAINPSLYNEIKQRQAQQQAELAQKTAETNIGAGTGGTQYEGLRKQLEQRAILAKQQQLGNLATGKITTAEYGRISQQLAGFPSAAIKSVENFGDALGKVSDALDTDKEAYDAFLYISTFGTKEQIDAISQYSDNILTLQSYIDNWKPELKGLEIQLSWGTVKIESKEQLQKLLEPERKAGATTLNYTLGQVQAAQAQAVKLPPLVGDYNKPLTGKSQDIIVQRGLAIQEKYLRETGKTTDEIAKFKAGIEAFYTTVDRGLGANFEAVNGLTQQFYDLGKAAAEAAGELEDIQPIGFQKFDIPMAQLETLAKQSLSIGKYWSTPKEMGGAGFNYDFKPEDQIAIDNQGIVQPLHADFKILALLLQDLNDKAQKQLDGQYNIPEGATFWVPLTAAYYRNKGGTGTGDLASQLGGMDLSENTYATDQNTQALREAAQAFRGDLGYSRLAQANAQRIENTYKGDLGYTRRALENRQAPLGYRGDLGYSRIQQPEEKLLGGTPTFQSGQMAQLLNQVRDAIISGFNNVFGQRQPAYGGSYDPRVPAGRNGVTGATQQLPQLNTKLDLRMSSQINLVVDGRVLAQTVQQYLASELLRAQQAGSSAIVKRYVI